MKQRNVCFLRHRSWIREKHFIRMCLLNTSSLVIVLDFWGVVVVVEQLTLTEEEEEERMIICDVGD